MKLTDEMREAALTARHAAHALGESRTDAVFAAGYRMGQQAMRERAAKMCEKERCRGVYPEELAHNDVCDNLAAAIRALSTEE
jgi:hypothetical protein